MKVACDSIEFVSNSLHIPSGNTGFDLNLFNFLRTTYLQEHSFSCKIKCIQGNKNQKHSQSSQAGRPNFLPHKVNAQCDENRYCPTATICTRRSPAKVLKILRKNIEVLFLFIKIECYEYLWLT